MKIDVEELKRFTRYHPEKQQKHSCKCKNEDKGKSLKTEKKRKLFPPELGEKLISDAKVDDLYDFSDIQELQTLYAPAITCCRMKQPCAETELYMIGYIKSSRDDVWVTLGLSVGKKHIKDHCR